MLRHLDLLNVVLALRFRQPGYPDCLSRLGYMLRSVGVTFVLPDRTKVVPDVIAQSSTLTLLVEVKGGKDLDGDQLARMLRVTPQDLRDSAYLPIDDVATHGVQVLYVCNEDVREEMGAALGARRATIVGFDGERFRLSGSKLADANLSRCLEEARVAHGAPPLAIFPFDADSTDADVARVVIPQIVAALVAGVGTISVDEIVSGTHNIVASLTRSTGAGSEHGALVKRVKNTLERLAAKEFSPWLEHVPKQPAYRFRQDLPVEAAPRTRELHRIRSAAQSYLEEQEPGRQVQLPLLFDDPPAEPAEGSTPDEDAP